MSAVPVPFAATWVANVRTPSEFAAAHIPTSVNVPLDDLQGWCDELVVSALANTCAAARVLSRLPYNIRACGPAQTA